MRNHPRPGKLFWFDCHQIATHRLGIAECIRVNCAGSGRLIAVMDVVDVGYVGNVGDIDVAHIGHVDLAQIGIAVVIPGIERLSGTERKPCHYAADAETRRKSRPSGKGHECRSIDRERGNRSWYPTPACSHQQPASIVKGSESPRRLVDPGPAPGLNPGPPSVTVGSPSHSQARGIPYRPVFSYGLPAPVLVQIVISRHVGADVLPRARIDVHPVAFSAPLIEAVGRWHADRGSLHWVRAI